MLATKAGVLSAAPAGTNRYTMNLFFQSPSIAKFLRVDDYITVSGKNYRVVTWSNFPNDFIDGNQITVEPVDEDVTPPNDTGYNSTVFTPGQLNFRPEVRTEGSLGNITVYSGRNYEYQLQASWLSASEANKAQVGDSIVDSAGREYTISFLAEEKFATFFRVTEVQKEGQLPVSGTATLYRPTTNKRLFQGTPVSDPARTYIRNRDDFVIDKAFADIEAQLGAGSIITITNASGETLSKGQPVSLNAFGKAVLPDVSTELGSETVFGIVYQGGADGEDVSVIGSGRIEDFPTSASYRDVLYVAKDGSLTSTKPDIGVNGFESGDFVIRVGQISQNPKVPNQKDLIVGIEIIGQL